MQPLPLKAFLSHRYKSPEVNLYFHELFTESAEVQFEVDVGSLPTNVTRLERMIRNSDAFIGIFPYPGKPKESANPNELRNASKYFRLECELAIRSAKPAIIFLDKRYAPYFDLPPTIHTEVFDIQEITGKGGSPRRARFQKIFSNFCDEVREEISSNALKVNSFQEMHVGIVVPTGDSSNRYYTQTEVETIERVLTGSGVSSIRRFPWPPSIHQEYISHIEGLDWLIMDVGQMAMNTGVVGYLHGRFVPTLRLMKTSKSQAGIRRAASYQTLFGGIEVGYPKDILPWNNSTTLEEGLAERLEVLAAPVERINSRVEAEVYFRRASLRKEAVFLSYSGHDYDLASQISRELRKRFQRVFDYKDGESITPGEPWIREIFEKLSVAKLGIPLVSSNYFSSGNCEHEAQEMVARQDSREMSVIPIKLFEKDDFKRPKWMQHRQYMHVYDYSDIETLVDNLIVFFDRSVNQ